MTWTAITDADVLDELTPAEKAQLNHIHAATHNLPRIVANVAAEFRQAISDAGTSLGSTLDNTIPPGFVGQAVALARWRWLITIPQAKTMQTVERKEAATKAEDLIEAIANGDRPVAGPEETTGGIARPSFGTRGGSATNDPPERDFTRPKLDGV